MPWRLPLDVSSPVLLPHQVDVLIRPRNRRALLLPAMLLINFV
ncbi:unnamed protein product [Haemonchus placei]|uniref:Uncharacterized protein n=1 Tax=Haemonchus placei TaxID=6290 RepID=A0A3P7X7N7_HAEPC|nr:unnamed protein product [Haemonchus placei]